MYSLMVCFHPISLLIIIDHRIFQIDAPLEVPEVSRVRHLGRDTRKVRRFGCFGPGLSASG